MVAGKIIRILSDDEEYQKKCQETLANIDDGMMITERKVCDFCCRMVESHSFCMLCKKQQNFNQMKLCDDCFVEHMINHSRSGYVCDMIKTDYTDTAYLCKIASKTPLNVGIF